jgi:hypothetical protein
VNRRFIAVVFCLYAATTLVVALHHERWRDEADVWLLLRDGGVTTMLERTGYVGSPALWYLLVGALTKVGLPYGSMTILNLIIAWAAVLLFLIASPFSRLTRGLFAFSFYPAYEYAVIARQYALLMLLFFAALATRRNQPLGFAICLALLANTTVHGLILAVILGALCVRSGAAVAVTLLGCALAVVQLMPPADAPSQHVIRGLDPMNAAVAIGNAFLPRVPLALAVIGGAAVLIAVFMTVDRVSRMFLIGAIAALSCLYVFVWFGTFRHSGLIMLVAIGALWLGHSECGGRSHRFAYESGGCGRRTPNVVVNVALAASVIVAIGTSVQEIRQPFSAAREMAAYLERHGMAAMDIVAHRAAPAAAVLAYLPPRRFQYAGMQRDGSYMLWDAAQRRGARMSYESAAVIAQKRGPHLLLLNDVLPNAERRGYRLLYATTGVPFRVSDERFLLYASELR